MDRQTMLEIAALKDRVNDLGQRISEHYMGLHQDSTDNIEIDQDALIEIDTRLSRIEDALIAQGILEEG